MCFLTDYLKYWLGSIHTYSSESAPVILVASHSENFDADPDKMVRQYVDFFSKLHTMQTYRIYDVTYVIWLYTESSIYLFLDEVYLN